MNQLCSHFIRQFLEQMREPCIYQNSIVRMLSGTSYQYANTIQDKIRTDFTNEPTDSIPIRHIHNNTIISQLGTINYIHKIVFPRTLQIIISHMPGHTCGAEQQNLLFNHKK